MKTIPLLLIFSIILISSFLSLPTEALWDSKQKEQMEQAKNSAFESAQKAKEVAEKAYEAAKEGTLGFGERLGERVDAAREAISSVGGKMADTVGDDFQGARETAGNIYEGAKEQAGNIFDGVRNAYEGAKERVQETGEAFQERAAQMAEMGREKGEEMREKAENLYQDANFFIKQAKHKSQSWLGLFWQSSCDIILFIPRTILNSLSWAWQTSCDIDEVGIRERVEERTQSDGDAAAQSEEKVKQQGGEAKDTIDDKERQEADMICEKAEQAGYNNMEEGNGEELLDSSQEQGKAPQQQEKNWFRCQMERIFKILFTLATFGFILFLSISFLSSQQRRLQIRDRLNKTASNIRNKANEVRKKGYIPVLSRGQPQGHLAKEIPVQHQEKLSTKLDEKGEGEEASRKTATSTANYAEKTREDPHKQRT